MTNSNPSVEDEICQNFTSRTAKLDSHIKCNISCPCMLMLTCCIDDSTTGHTDRSAVNQSFSTKSSYKVQTLRLATDRQCVSCLLADKQLHVYC